MSAKFIRQRRQLIGSTSSRRTSNASNGTRRRKRPSVSTWVTRRCIRHSSPGEIDYGVGQILDATKEASIEDNTIVILSSDIASGCAIPQVGGSTNGPWRGDFMNTPFERSMRAPAMIRWPGNVPAGVVTNEMLAAVDWLPTLAGMVGASKLVPRGRPIDGVDASSVSRLNPLLFVTVAGLRKGGAKPPHLFRTIAFIAYMDPASAPGLSCRRLEKPVARIYRVN
jgi:hypothetical protein